MLQAATALLQHQLLPGGHCSFKNEPQIPYFWDPRCADGSAVLGCKADGINPQCRFCGVGEYKDIECQKPSLCDFDNLPHLPFYWDSECSMGKLGCLADGRNMQCRFCGEFPYNGTVPCPPDATVPDKEICWLGDDAPYPFFWDATCEDGMLGCKADGKHRGCRFCGAGPYAEVACPASLCTFPPSSSHPSTPFQYYWEPRCWSTSEHVLGCNADGIHKECRFCGGGHFESVPCPEGALRR